MKRLMRLEVQLARTHNKRECVMKSLDRRVEVRNAEMTYPSMVIRGLWSFGEQEFYLWNKGKNRGRQSGRIDCSEKDMEMNIQGCDGQTEAFSQLTLPLVGILGPT